jgi:molybdopterin-guanine dinucleotide biosynthesis protein A
MVAGARIIERVARALRMVTDELLLVANAPEAAHWLPGVRTVADLRPGEGALGGLHAALACAADDARGDAGAATVDAGEAPDVLVVAWDMPFVSAALLGLMRARGEEGDVDAVLPESDGSRRGVEPLCAWYSARCLPPITAALEAGDRRVIAFLDAVRVARVGIEEVRRFGDPDRLFGNVNTAEDLARLQGMVPDVG